MRTGPGSKQSCFPLPAGFWNQKIPRCRLRRKRLRIQLDDGAGRLEQIRFELRECLRLAVHCFHERGDEQLFGQSRPSGLVGVSQKRFKISAVGNICQGMMKFFHAGLEAG